MTRLDGKFKVQRIADQLQIEVTAFSSGNIDVQLAGMGNLDWRIGVEQIAIDLDYDGKAFKPDITDIPKAATEYVAGEYTVPLEKAGANLAVRITDIMGESIVLTKKIG